MSRVTAIREIVKSLRDQHPNLVNRGRWLYITPVEHVLLGLLLDGSGDRNIVRPTTVIVPLWIPASVGTYRFGRRCKGKYLLTDPKVDAAVSATYHEFLENVRPHVSRIEDLDCYPVVRLGTHDDTFTYKGPYFDAAMGRFGDAKREIEAINYRLRHSKHTHFEEYERFTAVLNEETSNIALHLRAIEHATVIARGVEKYWQPTPFPFEVAGS